MFEDSTFESQGTIHTHSRNWMLATLLLNGSILLTLILIPLLHPSSMPNELRRVLIATPAAPHQIPPQPATHAPSQTTSAPRLIEVPLTLSRPQLQISRAPDTSGAPVSDEPITIGTSNSSSGTVPGGDPFSHAPSAAPRVVHPQGLVHVSTGVAAGMAISTPPPIYPAIARAARMEGTVILQATISKSGTIEGLHVVSGPPMLRQAALDAVQQWRYRPYLLNGEPVEVETTINVNFVLGR
jgi:periplasmic protein TonB